MDSSGICVLVGDSIVVVGGGGGGAVRLSVA